MTLFFNLTFVLKGYTEKWNGSELSCTDTCIVNNNICHTSAECIHDSLGHYTCQCRQGFTGNGYTCKGNAIQIKYYKQLKIYLNNNSFFFFITSI